MGEIVTTKNQSCRTIQKLKSFMIDLLSSGLDDSKLARKLNDHRFRQLDGKRWNKTAVNRYYTQIFMVR